MQNKSAFLRHFRPICRDSHKDDLNIKIRRSAYIFWDFWQTTSATYGSLKKIKNTWKMAVFGLKTVIFDWNPAICYPRRRSVPTTFAVDELNFCVRNGNRWILVAIITGMAPLVGLEPTTLRLTAACSTDWAKAEYRAFCQTKTDNCIEMKPSKKEIIFCLRFYKLLVKIIAKSLMCGFVKFVLKSFLNFYVEIKPSTY